MTISASHILAERLNRQRLAAPLADADEYLDLFRRLQPVSPAYFTRPGSPPSLVHRTTFDDKEVARRLRADRTLVKGRFLGGTIGYVLSADLAVYANAFCRPLTRFTYVQEKVLDVVRSEGPITPRLIKEETGLLNKEIMPALHRLQEAFLVYEDQVDDDWERGWYDFSTEWPDIEIDEAQREVASATVMVRFIESMVFVSEENVKDWTGWPLKRTKGLLSGMETMGTVAPAKVDGLGDGWVLAEDESLKPATPLPSVFMLHRADILVQSHTSELKRRFGSKDVLQYLLIDGKINGAVMGHWRIGPHDVEDIVVDLPVEQQKARREEIIEAVKWGYGPPNHRVLGHGGETVD